MHILVWHSGMCFPPASALSQKTGQQQQVFALFGHARNPSRAPGRNYIEGFHEVYGL